MQKPPLSLLKDKVAPKLSVLGSFILRYSLVFFFVAFGLLKFTEGEAKGIEPFVSGSPFISWMYSLFSVQMTSEIIGVIEISSGLLVASRYFFPLASAVGSVCVALTMCLTLSFLFTTKGMDPASADAGFLIKDLTLLGAALWTTGEALKGLK